jgi:hypothetical protein
MRHGLDAVSPWFPWVASSRSAPNSHPNRIIWATKKAGAPLGAYPAKKDVEQFMITAIRRPAKVLLALVTVAVLVGIAEASTAQAASAASEQTANVRADAVASPSERQVVDNSRTAQSVKSHERQVVDDAQRIRVPSPQKRR